MTVLIFNGNAPTQKYLRIGIQGNHKVDRLVFVLTSKQGEIDLFDFKPCLKVANKTLTYADVFTDLDIEKDEDTGVLKLTLILIDQITDNQSVDMQLLFKKNIDGVDVPIWQTKVFNVAFDDTLRVDKTINRQYPNVLKELDKKIDEVKQTAENTTIQRKSYLEFPNIGQAGFLYIDTTTHIAYHWSGEEQKYFEVETDLDNINIIYAGGNS